MLKESSEERNPQYFCKVKQNEDIHRYFMFQQELDENKDAFLRCIISGMDHLAKSLVS